jgi:hypothetical protein
MQQRVIVCGGRDYDDRQQLFEILDAAHMANPIVLLIHGAAKGADTLAAIWAKDSGVPCQAFQANWEADGKSAGPIRNQRMLDIGLPHLVIAFPGGAGTADMVRRAEYRKVPVARVRRRTLAVSNGER